MDPNFSRADRVGATCPTVRGIVPPVSKSFPVSPVTHQPGGGWVPLSDVSLMFLRYNGKPIDADDDVMAGVFEDVAAGVMTEAELATWFTENIMPLEF